MRFSPVLLATTGALALNTPDCFTAHGAGLAALSECATLDILTACFADLETHDSSDVESCLLTAGCPADDAPLEAIAVLDRCHEWLSLAELRRRMPEAAAITQAPQIPAHADIFRRQRSGDACMTTSNVDTSTCSTTTREGNVGTQCEDTVMTESDCIDGWLCSLDRAGQHVCMEVQDALDIAGIIIAVIFGVSIVLGVGILTFLCCRDRRQQKRLQAKAEATALARAATKKQRNAEARAPLMAEQPGTPIVAPAQGPGGPDPFSDRAHS